MTHYGVRERKYRVTDPEWVGVNIQVGEVVNGWSRRNNLQTYIGPDGGQGIAAAFYNPDTYEVEVNTDEAFGKEILPSMIGDLTERDEQFRWMKAAGLIMHEAMHARFSTVHPAKVDEDLKHMLKDDPRAKELIKHANEAYTLLEEGRIEAFGVRVLPKNTVFLRASALALFELDEEELAQQHPLRLAIKTLLLGNARVDGGVLKPEDIVKVRAITDQIVKAGVRRKMRAIWRTFQQLNDRRRDEYGQMLDLSVDWARIVLELWDQWKDEHPEEQEGEGEGQGGQGGSQELLDAIAKALAESGELTQLRAEREGAEQQAKEQAEAAAAEREAEAQEAQDSKSASSKVFGNQRSNGPSGTRSHSRETGRRDPSDREIAVAHQVAKAFKKAKYRDRITTQRRVEVPPGRLRTGAAMQQDAARSRGRNVRVDAFKQTRRHHIEDPNLSLGFMCDVSGSMGGAMAPMATATWIMADAVRRVKGKAAGVYFGNDVFSVLKPGEVPNKVVTYEASDGHESFDLGFKALNGALDLMNGSGARILVIASDGQFKTGEDEACVKWIRKARDRGIAVIWLAFKGAWAAKSICDSTGAAYVEVGTKVTDAADAIAKACTDELTRASAKR